MNPQAPAPLPPEWVDRLLGRMAVRYGDAWSRKWLGLDPGLVRKDWATELAGYHLPERQPRLRWALENLPGEPLNARQFRDLCRQAPEVAPELPQLPAPTADQRARLQGLRTELAGALAPKPARQWARTVLERHESGKHVATPAALDMARSTLRARFDELAASGYRNPRDAS